MSADLEQTQVVPETKDKEIVSTYRQLLTLHTQDLESSLHGPDYFNLEANSETTITNYTELSSDQVASLTTAWVDGSLDPVAAEFDPRVVGRSLQTLIDNHPKTTVETLVQVNMALGERQKCAEDARIDTLLYSTSQPAEVEKVYYHEIPEQSRFHSNSSVVDGLVIMDLLRKGIIVGHDTSDLLNPSANLSDMMTNFTMLGIAEPRDATMLKSLKNHVQTYCKEDEVENQKFFVGFAALRSEIDAHNKTPDINLVSELSTEDPNAVSVVFSYLYADKPPDAVPPNVKEIIDKADQIELNTLEQFTIQFIKENRQLNPDSNFARLLSEAQLEGGTVAHIVKTVLDLNHGEWKITGGQKLDEILVHQADQATFEDTSLFDLAAPFIGFKTEPPEFINRVFSRSKNNPSGSDQYFNDTLLTNFSYPPERDLFDEIDQYPNNPLYTFMSQGSLALPPDLAEHFHRLYQNESYKDSFVTGILKRSVTNYDSIYQYEAFKLGPDIMAKYQSQLSQIISPEIWQLVKQTDPDTVTRYLRGYDIKSEVGIKYGWSDDQEIKAPLTSLIPPDVVQAWCSKLSINRELNREALDELQVYGSIIDSRFIDNLPPPQKWYLTYSKANPEAAGYILYAISEITDKHSDCFVIRNGQPLLNAAALEAFMVSSSRTHEDQNGVEKLFKAGLIDLSQTDMYSPQQARLINFFKDGYSKIGNNFITTNADTGPFDFELFDKTFTVKENVDTQGQVKRKYTLNPDAFVDKCDASYSNRYWLGSVAKAGLIDYRSILLELAGNDSPERQRNTLQYNEEKLLMLASLAENKNKSLIPGFIAGLKYYSPEAIKEVKLLSQNKVFDNSEARVNLVKYLLNNNTSTEEITLLMLKIKPDLFSNKDTLNEIVSQTKNTTPENFDYFLTNYNQIIQKSQEYHVDAKEFSGLILSADNIKTFLNQIDLLHSGVSVPRKELMPFLSQLSDEQLVTLSQITEKGNQGLIPGLIAEWNLSLEATDQIKTASRGETFTSPEARKNLTKYLLKIDLDSESVALSVLKLNPAVFAKAETTDIFINLIDTMTKSTLPNNEFLLNSYDQILLKSAELKVDTGSFMNLLLLSPDSKLFFSQIANLAQESNLDSQFKLFAEIWNLSKNSSSRFALLSALTSYTNVQPVTLTSLLTAEFHLSDIEIAKVNSGIATASSNSPDFKKNYLDFIVGIPRWNSGSPTKEQLVHILTGAPELVDFKNLHQMIYTHSDKLAAISIEQLPTYVKIFQRIDASPSQEIQKLKDQLAGLLLDAPHPLEALDKIESIFIKNNLPVAGKVFKVFQVLYPASRLKSAGYISPVLRSIPSLDEKKNETHFYNIIYRDLMKAQVESGNLGLKEFLTTIKNSSTVIDKAVLNINQLTPTENQQLRYYVKKLETLYDHTIFGSIRLRPQSDELEPDSNSGMQIRLEQLRLGLGLKPEESISNKILKLYVQPLGYQSIGQVLSAMESARTIANARGHELAENAIDGYISLIPGDLLKGIDPTYFGNIIQNGSVAKEFLGASATSDMTPLDTDLGQVLPEDLTGKTDAEKFTSALNTSPSSGYGSLIEVFRDRGQFQRTVQGQDAVYDPTKYELFITGVVDSKRHVGTRTALGPPDFYVARDNSILHDTFLTIAQNGCYRPVVDTTGKIIFTPETYDKYRRIFNGIDQFLGDPITVEVVKPTDPTYSRVHDLIPAIKEHIGNIESVESQIRQMVQTTIGHQGVELKSDYDCGILGAELLDTGSTGRGTSVPGEGIDFDMMLLLDQNGFDKSSQISEELLNTLKPTENKSHTESKYVQLRSIGSQAFGDKPVDVDIGLINKAQVRQFSSHEAIISKLNYIKEHEGEDTYFEVIANIVLAKELLKAEHAYKKEEDGGMGGIGVENWILQHNGNILTAFKSFYDASHDENGATLSFDKFRENYQVLDPGVNLKKLNHDNYISVLKETGYQAMLKVIQNTLNLP